MNVGQGKFRGWEMYTAIVTGQITVSYMWLITYYHNRFSGHHKCDVSKSFMYHQRSVSFREKYQT